MTLHELKILETTIFSPMNIEHRALSPQERFEAMSGAVRSRP